MKKDFPRKSLSHDKYKTDQWLWNLCVDDSTWDPCPIDWSPDKHGCSLTMDWTANRIFINPPYSNPLPWVEKAIETHQSCGTFIALLLKHDTSTKWYKLLHEAGAHILMVSGRLKYGTSRGAAFPSILVVLS
jgi:hypothetical protein